MSSFELSSQLETEMISSNSVVKLVQQTALHLESIWHEVGFSDEEKKHQFEILMEEFKELCDFKISEEEEIRNQFLLNIQNAQNEIRSIYNKLKEEFDEDIFNQIKHLTLTDQLATLENKLIEENQRKEKRRNVLIELKEIIVRNSNVIGQSVDPIYMDVDSDWTNSQIEKFQQKRKELENEIENRKKKIIQIIIESQILLREMDEKCETEIDIKIMNSLINSSQNVSLTSLEKSNNNFGIDDQSISLVSQRFSQLTNEKERRKERLTQLGEEISRLWLCLHIENDVREAFSASVNGLGMSTILAGEKELNRLNELKKEKIGEIIENIRIEIRNLWEEIGISENEKMNCVYMTIPNNQLNDEILSIHENELNNYKIKYELILPILKAIEKREEIIKERLEVDELLKDSSRLTRRGSAAELARLERMERRVKKELPILTDALKKRIFEWEKNEGKLFVYKEMRYIDYMEETENEWNRLKEAEKAARDAKKKEERDRTTVVQSNTSNQPKSVNSAIKNKPKTQVTPAKKPTKTPLSPTPNKYTSSSNNPIIRSSNLNDYDNKYGDEGNNDNGSIENDSDQENYIDTNA